MADAPKTIKALGISWYRKEDYPRLLSIFEDSDNLPRTFEKWFLQATAFENGVIKSGKRVFRIIIDPNSFPGWCAANKLKVNTHARQLFVARQTKEMATGRSN
jgi:hypothetical protein